MTSNDLHMTEGNDEATRKAIRRTAIGLAIVAASVYFGFMAMRLL